MHTSTRSQTWGKNILPYLPSLETFDFSLKRTAIFMVWCDSYYNMEKRQDCGECGINMDILYPVFSFQPNKMIELIPSKYSCLILKESGREENHSKIHNIRTKKTKKSHQKQGGNKTTTKLQNIFNRRLNWMVMILVIYSKQRGRSLETLKSFLQMCFFPGSYTFSQSQACVHICKVECIYFCAYIHRSFTLPAQVERFCETEAFAHASRDSLWTLF